MVSVVVVVVVVVVALLKWPLFSFAYRYLAETLAFFDRLVEAENSRDKRFCVSQFPDDLQNSEMMALRMGISSVVRRSRLAIHSMLLGTRHPGVRHMSMSRCRYMSRVTRSRWAVSANHESVQRLREGNCATSLHPPLEVVGRTG